MHSTDPNAVVVDEAALLEALAGEVVRYGTQKDAAASLGISGVYLSDVLNGRRSVGVLASRLGYTALTLYVPATGAPISTRTAADVLEGVRSAMGKGGAA